MKKSIVFVAAALLLLFAFPVAVSAAGDTTVETSTATSQAGTTPGRAVKNTQHFLEWGVFGIAVGEFAGLMGRGLSQVLRDRRAAKVTVPTAQPERPLPLLLYAERVKDSVR